MSSFCWPKGDGEDRGPVSGERSAQGSTVHTLEIQKRTQTTSPKTLLSLLTGIISYVVLISVGLDLAGFWAFVIFLLAYIPTIGSLLGVVFPALMALLQFGGGSEFLTIAVGLGAAQLVIGNVLEPRMMGKSLNLSSLVVIISLAVWGSICDGDVSLCPHYGTFDDRSG